MAENRCQVIIDDICKKMVGNGFPRVSRHGHRGSQEDHGRNGRKWQKMGCRGKMAENGFPRVLRHSPTTMGVLDSKHDN